MENNLVFTKKEMESLVMNQRKGIILNDESIVESISEKFYD